MVELTNHLGSFFNIDVVLHGVTSSSLAAPRSTPGMSRR